MDFIVHEHGGAILAIILGMAGVGSLYAILVTLLNGGLFV